MAALWWSGRVAPLDAVAAAEARLQLELESRRVPTNGIELHVVEAGPQDGPPVLLLHGFPEFWYAWHRQIAALARAGFRVVAPDQRGYNVSDKPKDLAGYRVDNLVRDALGLLDALGHDRVYLAGHDWGGSIAWRLAIDHPERVRALVVFNMGHPLAWDDVAAAGGGEPVTSWYRSFFRLPWLPQLVARAGGWAPLVGSLRDTSRPGTFSDEDLDLYRAAWARDGAMGRMIDWYRADPVPVGEGTVQVPTRVVWGRQDAFLPFALAGASVARCRDAELRERDDLGHWLLHEDPVYTSRALIEFFRALESRS